MSFDMEELRENGALFSDDRVYRYALWREWNEPEVALALFINEASESQVANKGFVNWICLNPSTADETIDDPTVAKCIRLAKKWGYSGFCMTNLFAFRATEPEEMKKQDNPIGSGNTQMIEQIAKLASLVMCGWGNDGGFMHRSLDVMGVLRSANIKLHCLKRNENGEPAHPLYLKETLIPRLIQ